MTVKEFIGTLESSDRLRIIEGKAEVYVGYLAAFKPFADHEISEEYRKYSRHTANMLGITVIDANQIKKHLEYEEKRQERAASDYAKLHSCEFCSGSKLYSCTGYDCREPYRRAYEYALSRIRERQET